MYLYTNILIFLNLLLILRRQAGITSISFKRRRPPMHGALDCTRRYTMHLFTYFMFTYLLTYSLTYLLTDLLIYSLWAAPAPKHAVHKALWRIYILCRGEKFNLFHIGLFWIKWVDVPKKDGDMAIHYKELSNTCISNFDVSFRYVRGRLYPQRQIRRYIFWKSAFM